MSDALDNIPVSIIMYNNLLDSYQMVYMLVDKCNNASDLLDVLPRLNMDMINIAFKTIGFIGDTIMEKI